MSDGGWDLGTQDYNERTVAQQVKDLTAQADLMDRKADSIKALMGRSPFYKHVDVWRLRQHAKDMRARAVTLLVEDATT